ncbi:MAG TPA: DUF429 domain-containing protein [Dehalococcoidia bacterium]|nr:DUF429 domain-containing protein [Dehalococcoidia bacterium]
MTNTVHGDDLRVIAIDWSGRKTHAERTIWLAEVREGALVRLEDGRDREQIVGELLRLLDDARPAVVGLDFAFSMPAWFVRDRRARCAEEMWAIAEREGEDWLAACEPPFWGRTGTRKSLADAECLRATDRACAARDLGRPKSVFQVGGAGAVGTGSIRGMPALRALRAAGFAVWPFCEPAAHTVIEIYPRAFTGPVVKSDEGARTQHLAQHFPSLPLALRTKAGSSEDAFDAAVAALRMWEHRDELVHLPPERDETTRLEGAIWLPACAPQRPKVAS